MLKPIEDARLITVEELRRAYADIYAGQGIITGRLEASVRRGEQQARLIDAVGSEGTAANINAKLASFAEEVNGVFKKIDDFDEKIGMSENLSKIEAGDLVNILKQGLQKALVDAGLKEPKTKGGTEVEEKEG